MFLKGRVINVAAINAEESKIVGEQKADSGTALNTSNQLINSDVSPAVKPVLQAANGECKSV